MTPDKYNCDIKILPFDKSKLHYEEVYELCLTICHLTINCLVELLIRDTLVNVTDFVKQMSKLINEMRHLCLTLDHESIDKKLRDNKNTIRLLTVKFKQVFFGNCVTEKRTIKFTNLDPRELRIVPIIIWKKLLINMVEETVEYFSTPRHFFYLSDESEVESETDQFRKKHNDLIQRGKLIISKIVFYIDDVFVQFEKLPALQLPSQLTIKTTLLFSNASERVFEEYKMEQPFCVNK